MSEHLDYQSKKELILGFNRAPLAQLVELVNCVSFQDPNKLLASLTWDSVCKTRMAMEIDLSLVHPIVYMLVVNSTGDKFLGYLRGNGGTETRLRGASCGFGGHVDILDFIHSAKGVLDPVLTVQGSAYRELNEELKFKVPEGVIPEGDKVPQVFGVMNEVGVIYEPDDEVGNTHLAIVAVFQVAEGVTFESGEVDQIGAPRWISFDSEEVNDLPWENWSKYLLQAKDGILEAAGIDGTPLTYAELAGYSSMEMAIQGA